MKQIKIDLGKLLLRVGVGGLMLFHGIFKMMHGFQGIKNLLIAKGLPELLWIGAFVGEVIGALCVLLGVFTRISALTIAIVMVFSIYLKFGMGGFELGKTGAPLVELNLLYLFSALAIFFVGGGRYALYKRETGLMA
ncbi:MAG: DoxX family protein [Flavobacteriaceae bacterium]